MVTEAIVGHLRSNPNVLDPFIRGNRFEATGSLDKGRPLRRPILDDHVSRQRVKRTLGVACALCVVFQLMFLYMLFVSYELFLFTIHSFMHLTVKGCGK